MSGGGIIAVTNSGGGGNTSIDGFNTDYKSKVITVGTTQVEAITGSVNLTDRKAVLIINDSDQNVYAGPSGVTTSGINKGTILIPSQSLFLTAGAIRIFVIADTPNNNVIVQEFS
jgi:hypothetical protein